MNRHEGLSRRAYAVFRTTDCVGLRADARDCRCRVDCGSDLGTPCPRFTIRRKPAVLARGDFLELVPPLHDAGIWHAVPHRRLADRWRAYRLCLLGGLVLVALGIAAGPFSPFTAIVLAALGNAAFHVGAGALVMTHSPDRTAAAGVFVGPGAVGLAFGVWCVRVLNLGPWIFLLPLAACAALALVPAFAEKRSTQSPPAAVSLSRSVLVLCLATIFLTIAIRSANGHGVWAVHEGQRGVIWGLAFAACAGNILGGFVADRLGWVTTCVLALLLSAPLLSIFVDNGSVAIVGMVLFQMTMPVTLTAVWRAMPADAGLAFGLAAFAVLAGVAPVYVCPIEWITPRPLLLSLTLVAVAGILVGLPPIVRSYSDHRRLPRKLVEPGFRASWPHRTWDVTGV